VSVCLVEVEGVQPSVAEGDVDEGLECLCTEGSGGRNVVKGAALLLCIGDELGWGERGRRGGKRSCSQWEEEWQRAG